MAIHESYSQPLAGGRAQARPARAATPSRSAHRLLAHAGLLYAVLLGLGIFGIAGWLPVPRPSLDAAGIAALFQQHTTQIRIGMTVLAAASVLFWPFAVAISHQMQRIEGESHPYADLQRACATGTVIAVLVAAYLWLALAYRPELTPPSTMQLVNDLGWLCFIGMYPPATLQSLAIGACVLGGDPQRVIYPRWLGWFNLWIALLFVPGALLPFFKTGPFAWNGLISFWMVAALFFGWILVMWWCTLQAIDRDRREG